MIGSAGSEARIGFMPPRAGKAGDEDRRQCKDYGGANDRRAKLPHIPERQPVVHQQMKVEVDGIQGPTDHSNGEQHLLSLEP